MKQRFRLYRRKQGGRYYIHNELTGKQESLHTNDRAKATRLLHKERGAGELPAINLQIARAYADVKLLLIDRGQRTRRRDDQHFIHGLALGGVRGDGVAVRERSIILRNHPAIGQQHRNHPVSPMPQTSSPLMNRLRLAFACSNSLSPAAGNFSLFLQHQTRPERLEAKGKYFQNRRRVRL